MADLTHYEFIKLYIIHREATVQMAEAAWKDIQAFMDEEDEKLFDEKED